MSHPAAASLIQLAHELQQAGDCQQACLVYARALKAEPNNVAGLLLMGTAQQELGRHDRAINFLRRAIRLDPTQAQAHFHLGLSLAKMKQWGGAIDAYQQAIAHQPAYFEALCNLGNVLGLSGRRDAALDIYHRALSIRDDSAVLHYNLGVLFQEQMRPADAIVAYQSAIRLQPSYAAAYSNLSVALCETGRISEGQAANDLALKLDPQLPESHFNAHTYHLPDDRRQAIECLRRACHHAPDDEKFRFFLGMLLDDDGQTDEAARQFAVKSPSKAFRADLQAWHYLKSRNPRPTMLGNAAAVLSMALQQARPDGLVMEFGVYQGTSIRQIAALTPSTVHGFDSFAGIPEAWNDEQAGSYSTEGRLPEVPDNVQLHVGWFEDSIPTFIKTHREPVRLMNIDCDLYRSTKTVLDLFQAQIGPGAVLVFDEFIGNLSWQEDEFKAFHEAAKVHGWSFDLICHSFVTKQVAIRIRSA